MNDAAADGEVLAELAETILRIARDLDPHHAGVDVMPLTGSETAVLRWVHRNAGTSPSEAAEGTGLKRPNLSTVVRSLEHKGLVTRVADPTDHRQVRLHTTDLADRSVDRLRQFWAQRMAGALGERADVSGAVAEAVALLEHLDQGLRGR